MPARSNGLMQIQIQIQPYVPPVIPSSRRVPTGLVTLAAKNDVFGEAKLRDNLRLMRTNISAVLAEQKEKKKHPPGRDDKPKYSTLQ